MKTAPLTENEQILFATLDPNLIALYMETYAVVRPADQVIDLSEIFNHAEADYWADESHLTPEGNAEIAQAMWQHLQHSAFTEQPEP